MTAATPETRTMRVMKEYIREFEMAPELELLGLDGEPEPTSTMYSIVTRTYRGENTSRTWARSSRMCSTSGGAWTSTTGCNSQLSKGNAITDRRGSYTITRGWDEVRCGWRNGSSDGVSNTIRYASKALRECGIKGGARDSGCRVHSWRVCKTYIFSSAGSDLYEMYMLHRHHRSRCMFHIIGSRGWLGNLNLQCSIEIVIPWHHEVTTHQVKFMLAHHRCAVCAVSGCADAEAGHLIALLTEVSIRLEWRWCYWENVIQTMYCYLPRSGS